MAKSLACPPEYTLSELMQGKINEPELSELAEHLESCGGCQEKARTLSPFDTFVEPLRGNAEASRKIAESIPQPLVEIVKKIARVKEGVGSDTIGLSHDSQSPAEGANEVNFLASPKQPDEIGRLGSYRILSILGKGGMGVVFLADDPKLDRKVALKVMLPKIAANPAAKERFEREARAAARLKSDHIVHIYQVSEERGIPYLAMELLEGAPLDKFLEGGKKLTLPQILRIGRETAKGLAAAHEKGLIHRDIKPGNLWLDQTNAGRVKILDFGLARSEKDDVHLTQSGAIVGTPAYMAPEQARADKPVDARADLFSLGCVLYRLCAGDIPFKAETTMGVLLAIAMNEPPALAKINDQIPSPLSELIMQLLEKDPAKRPASARVVIDRLTAIEKNLGGAANDTIHVNPASQVVASHSGTALLPAPAQADTRSEIAPLALPSKPRSNVGIWLALACVLLLLGGGAYGIYQLYFDTPHGRIVVQIEGDDIEARFKKGKIELYDKDGKLLYTLEPSQRIKELKAGNYGIKVVGVDGLELDTDKFEMKRGGKVVVRVRLDRVAALGKKDGEVKEVKQDPKTPAAGDYSLSFDTTSKEIQLPFSLDPSAPFTLECYVTPKDTKNQTILVSLNQAIVVSPNHATLFYNGPKWGIQVSAKNGRPTSMSDELVVLGKRTHVAGVVTGNEIRLFIDGHLVKTTELTGGAASIDKPLPVRIGRTDSGRTDSRRTDSALVGILDEVRISKVARYDKDFTPQKRFEPDADTLALYHFDEGQGDVLNDSSGNGHHGKIVGAKWVNADGTPIVPPPTPSTDSFHLVFDGKASHVVLPVVGFAAQKPYTVETWVRADRLPSGNLPPGQDRISVLAGGGMQLRLDPKSAWAFFAGNSAPAGPQISADSPPRPGMWTHLAAVSDGKQRRFFVNGRQEGKSTKENAPRNVDTNFLLGAEPLGSLVEKKGARNFFEGALRETRISKTARYTKDFTPAQRFEPDADTLALYHFDEGAGDVLKDSSGNGHHGKIVGAKWVNADGTPIAPTRDYALSFDGKENHVHIPTLGRKGAGPMTMEAYVIPSRLKKSAPGYQVVVHMNGLTTMTIKQTFLFWTGSIQTGSESRVVQSEQETAKLGEQAHVAAVWDEKQLRLYVNGRLSKGIPLKTIRAGIGQLQTYIGVSGFGGPKQRWLYPFEGVIDEVRISKTARYDKEFTPAKRFEPDADTLALYHFDEGTGDELKDSSGNEHHGKIVGAKWVKADGTPIAPPSADAYALSITAKGQHVEIPSLKVDASVPFTHEAYIIRKNADNIEDQAILGAYQNAGLHLHPTGKIQAWSSAGTKVNAATSNQPAPLDKKIHVAGVFDGKQLHLFLDGKLAGSSERIVAAAGFNVQPYHIGWSTNAFQGVITEVRISKVARYGADFTPAKRFEPDKDTLALYHFDEGKGDVLNDSSGNKHHGKIIGAKWVNADGSPIGFAPLDPAWLKQVATLPAKEQVEAVKVELMKRNPGFDAELTYKIDKDGAVTELAFPHNPKLVDIAPVRVFTQLRTLSCSGTNVSDLSPLMDMKLTQLVCQFTPVSDLSPLKGMNLKSLTCQNTQVSDLSPLKGMDLMVLTCQNTRVSDLSPLKDAKRMYSLSIGNTNVSDLSPLKDVKLTMLNVKGSKVSDLSLLREMPLKSLSCDFDLKRDTEILRSIKTLETINNKPAAEFWKEVDKK